MAGKRVAIEIDGSGKMHVEWDGFSGNSCFQEADKLTAALAHFGVECELIKVDPKKDEVEVSGLENQASVGH